MLMLSAGHLPDAGNKNDELRTQLQLLKYSL